jgi:hypothetical protein
VDPERLQQLIHPRFAPDLVGLPGAGARALVSVVPFEDQDFRFGAAPWLRFRFGQTNYRAYVVDRETGERLVWFFGTTLDSWSVYLPRLLWRLPWHPGRIRIDAEWDAAARRYRSLRVRTAAEWAPLELELEDSGAPPAQLAGFDDLEAALVTLTHPLRGAYFRRDGRLGTYRIWHDRLRMSEGRLLRASVPLLDRLGLVAPAAQQSPHSVLIQHETEFDVILPPGLYEP